MGMEYTVFVGSHEVDEIKISTTRAVQDWKPINDFKATLSTEERKLFSVVDEYSLDALDEAGEFYGEPTEPTQQEQSIINRYNRFMGFEEYED